MVVNSFLAAFFLPQLWVMAQISFHLSLTGWGVEPAARMAVLREASRFCWACVSVGVFVWVDVVDFLLYLLRAIDRRSSDIARKLAAKPGRL